MDPSTSNGLQVDRWMTQPGGVLVSYFRGHAGHIFQERKDWDAPTLNKSLELVADTAKLSWLVRTGIT